MKKLLLIFVFPLIIFWPSVTAFFTNDDFYFLRIAQDITLDRFINFFNIFTKNYDGFGVYRPLSTQIFYMLQNPILMHIVVYLTFFGVLYLIYKLGIKIFRSEKVGLISTFLYAVSATHFAHFYYLATYQELLMTLFVLLSIYSNLGKRYNLSILFFVLGLMSKETAVVLPFLLVLVDWHSNSKFNLKKYIPSLAILCLYVTSHFFLYGLATGDSYIWDFSIRKLFNTIFWYLLWSFNLPETLVDFIGPGLSVNPNLFKYWASTIYPIFGLFALEMVTLTVLMVKKLDSRKSSLFSMLWFLISLTPVIFLPIHKFSFYLTLPLIGITYRIAYLLKDVRSYLVYVFCGVWLACSLLTINHSRLTSWITNSQEISKSVYTYFSINETDGGQISFVDTPEDYGLPWSPTAVVKNALSDKNFFYVYFPQLADKIEYNGQSGTQVKSRQFLGY